jgi:hypothetical protein
VKGNLKLLGGHRLDLRSKERVTVMFQQCVRWGFKAGGVLLIVASFATAAYAHRPFVPEIDPSSANSAIALLVGGLLMLAGRRREC